MKKEYVKVISETDETGLITPKTIIWKDDTKFHISKVLDYRPCASLKTGGIGIRYTIQIDSTITYLFLEETRWFVETKKTC